MSVSTDTHLERLPPQRDENTYRLLEDEASAAHKLLSELLSAPIGDIISWNNKALAWRHVISDLVHLSVYYPPLRFLIFILHSKGRRLRPPPICTGFGPHEPKLAGGELKPAGLEFCAAQHKNSPMTSTTKLSAGVYFYL